MRIFLLILKVLRLIANRQERKEEQRILREVSDADRLENTRILADTISVRNALQIMLSRNVHSEKPLNLKALFEISKSYDAIFDELKKAQIGFQMNVLPVYVSIQPNTIYFVEHVTKHFKRINKGVYDFILKNYAEFRADQLDSVVLLSSTNPGSYYDGVNLSDKATKLKDHPLRSELEVINLIDIPFVDVLCHDDESLWELAQLCPKLRWVDLSASELESTGLERLNLHQLNQLQVLSLMENNLEELPSYINSFSSLQYLNLQSNEIRKLPGYLGTFKDLQYLNLKGNPISESEIQRIKDKLNKTVVVF